MGVGRTAGNSRPQTGSGEVSTANTCSLIGFFGKCSQSNTIVFAEKYGRCGGNVGNPSNNGGSLWARNNPTNSTYGPYFNVRLAGPTFSFQFQPHPVENPATCNFALPSTAHTGGILVGLGDGSTRLVNPGVSTQTWWFACTPAGGETLGADW